MRISPKRVQEAHIGQRWGKRYFIHEGRRPDRQLVGKTHVHAKRILRQCRPPLPYRIDDVRRAVEGVDDGDDRGRTIGRFAVDPAVGGPGGVRGGARERVGQLPREARRVDVRVHPHFERRSTRAVVLDRHVGEELDHRGNVFLALPHELPVIAVETQARLVEVPRVGPQVRLVGCDEGGTRATVEVGQVPPPHVRRGDVFRQMGIVGGDEVDFGYNVIAFDICSCSFVLFAVIVLG